MIQYFSISNDNHTIFCSCNGNVQSSWIFQKPNSRALIWSYTRNDDVILLSSLISINRSNFELFVIIWILRADLTIFLQETDNISSLTLVGSNDTDLLGFNTCPFEIKENLINLLSFSSVEIWSTRCWKLFESISVQKEIGFALRPWKLTVNLSISVSNTILKGSIIKSIGWEIT